MPKFNDVTVVCDDGNAFAIIGAVSKGLKRAGHTEAANQFSKDAMQCASYDALLVLATETVNVEV